MHLWQERNVTVEKSQRVRFFFFNGYRVLFFICFVVMVNETYRAPSNSARVNAFVKGILSIYEPGEVPRSPYRKTPRVAGYHFIYIYIFLGYIVVSYIFEFYIVLMLSHWRSLCSARNDSSRKLHFKDVSVITTINKLLHGNENHTLHHEEKFKVTAEFHMFTEISPFKEKKVAGHPSSIAFL